MRVGVWAICISVLLQAGTAHSEEAHCGPQDYTSLTAPDFECPGPDESAVMPLLDPPASVPVRQGQQVAAQWDGALVHRDRLLEVGLRITGLRRLRWVDTLRFRQSCDIELQMERGLAEARLDLMTQQRDAYSEQLQRSEARVLAERAWYRSWWFGVLVGTVVTAGLVALTAYALDAVSD